MSSQARPLVVAATLLLVAGRLQAQERPWRSAEQFAAIPRAELDAISARGWRMVQYHQAAWMATDEVTALNPREELVRAYLAREREDRRWEVVFGRLNVTADSFLVAFRAEQTEPQTTTFRTYEMRPPKADGGYFARAARALEVCRRDFGEPPRRYNTMVIPVVNGLEWYVYFLPAKTVSGIWPHGGDMRYRVSGDGRTILERRRMHNAILEVRVEQKRDSSELEAVMHTALLDDRPEDSDVFHVITRRPRVRELIVSRSYYFSIDTLGRIMAYNRDTTIKR